MDRKSSSTSTSSETEHLLKENIEESVIVSKTKRTCKRINYYEYSSSDEGDNENVDKETVDVETVEINVLDSSKVNLDDKSVKEKVSSVSHFSKTSDLLSVGVTANDESLKTESSSSFSPSSSDFSESGISPHILDAAAISDDASVTTESSSSSSPSSSDLSEPESSDLLNTNPTVDDGLQIAPSSPSNSNDSSDSSKFRNSSPFRCWGQVLKQNESSKHSKVDDLLKKDITEEVHDENIRNDTNGKNACISKAEWEKWQIRATLRKDIERIKELRESKKEVAEENGERGHNENITGPKLTPFTDPKKIITKRPFEHSEDQKNQKSSQRLPNTPLEINEEMSNKNSAEASTSLLGQGKEIKRSGIDDTKAVGKHGKEGSNKNLTDLKYSTFSDPMKTILKRQYVYSEDHQKSQKSDAGQVDNLSRPSKPVGIKKEIPSNESSNNSASVLNEDKEIIRSKIDNDEVVVKKRRKEETNEDVVENCPLLMNPKNAIPKTPFGHSEDQGKNQNTDVEQVDKLSGPSKQVGINKGIPSNESTNASASPLTQIKKMEIDYTEVVGKKQRKDGSNANTKDLKFSSLTSPRKACLKRSFEYTEDHQTNQKSDSRQVGKLSGPSKPEGINKEISSEKSPTTSTSPLAQIKKSKMDDTETVSK